MPTPPDVVGDIVQLQEVELRADFSDECARTGRSDNQSLLHQVVQRTMHGGATHAKLSDEFELRGHPVPLQPFPRHDAVDDIALELLVQRQLDGLLGG